MGRESRASETRAGEPPATAAATASAGERDLARALAGHANALDAHLPRDAATARSRTRVFFAPGRVNLMGAHLDYNGGPVMPIAIDRGTYFAVRERADGRVRLRSTYDSGGVDFDAAEPPDERSGRWIDYPIGVLRRLFERAGPRGADVLFGGNLPVGAGLSSSASICVGTAFALDRVWSVGLAARETVEFALAAEREFVGVRCGIMDPFAVGLARPGQILWLDCKDASYEHLALDSGAVAIAVADTGVRRELAQGAFNQRVAEAAEAYERLRADAPGSTCLRDVPLGVLDRREPDLPPAIARRARHVLEEVRRTFEARDALARGDLRGFGAKMLASHRSLRELYEVSVPELDTLVEAAALRDEVYGARLTGAGFGGCAVILLERAGAPRALDSIASTFQRRFGRRPAIEAFGSDPGPREVELG